MNSEHRNRLVTADFPDVENMLSRQGADGTHASPSRPADRASPPLANVVLIVASCFSTASGPPDKVTNRSGRWFQ